MSELFDVRPGPVVVSPMFGPAHLGALVGLFVLLAALIAFRRRLRRGPPDGRWVRGLSAFILLDQALVFVLYFVYDYQPFWERFPLHLCAGLSLVVPTLVLLRKREALEWVAVWAIGAGFISIVNMSLTRNPPWSYVYVHYLWMHYYLFAIPIYFVLRGELSLGYVDLLRSIALLLGISLVIFAIDAMTGANYMYLGPESTLEIPFLPEAWLEWPWSYPTFVGVALVLFHLVYAGMRWADPDRG